MSRNDNYYVVVIPKHIGNFRPCVLEYGIDYEKAAAKVKWYINDHGLTFKQGGKTYPALIQIHKANDTLPKDYRLLTFKEAKE